MRCFRSVLEIMYLRNICYEVAQGSCLGPHYHSHYGHNATSTLESTVYVSILCRVHVCWTKQCCSFRLHYCLLAINKWVNKMRTKLKSYSTMKQKEIVRIGSILLPVSFFSYVFSLSLPVTVSLSVPELNWAWFTDSSCLQPTWQSALTVYKPQSYTLVFAKSVILCERLQLI